MSELSVPTAPSASGITQARSPEEARLRELATLFVDVIDPFSAAMARHIHAEVPALRALKDERALGETKISCEANLREIFSMIRARLPEESIDTPPQALEYARYLRGVGIGFDNVTAAYQYGVAMFRNVFGLELSRRVTESAELAAVMRIADAFLSSYISTILTRLRTEFDSDLPVWHPSPQDPELARPESAEAARAFTKAQIDRGAWLAASPEQSRAHLVAQRTLDDFIESLQDAATDPEISRRLALADAIVTFVLADEPGLAATLLLDRTPIEVVPGSLSEAEITLWIASFDLELLIRGELKLSMAISRDRVRTEGPVRKFLRVVPILSAYVSRQRELRALRHESNGSSRISEFVDDEDDRARRRRLQRRAARTARGGQRLPVPLRRAEHPRGPSRRLLVGRMHRRLQARSAATGCSTGSTSGSRRG